MILKTLLGAASTTVLLVSVSWGMAWTVYAIKRSPAYATHYVRNKASYAALEGVVYSLILCGTVVLAIGLPYIFFHIGEMLLNL